jgi:hypothetical protein
MNKKQIKEKFSRTVFQILNSNQNKKVLKLAEDVGFEKSEVDPFNAFSKSDLMYYAVLQNKMTIFDLTHVDKNSLHNVVSADYFADFEKQVRMSLEKIEKKELTFPRDMMVSDDEDACCEDDWHVKTILGYCEELEFPWLYEGHAEDEFYAYKFAKEIDERQDITQKQIEKNLGYKINIIE